MIGSYAFSARRCGLCATAAGLIYSTCSLEAEENETVVAEALEREKGFRMLRWREQIRALEREGTLHAGTAERLFPSNAPDHFLRTFPGLYPGDGFFAACIMRE